jgi:hypothetical protein
MGAEVITVLVMSDGRGDYLEQTIPSFEEMVSGTITRRVIHDDSGNSEYHRWLINAFPEYEVVVTGKRRGYSGAVQSAWAALKNDTNRFTFHLEDDFLFNRPVDLDELAEFLAEKEWLAQVSLRRGPWGREVVGFVEDNPGWYVERSDRRYRWLESRYVYTMTPHLYRSELRAVGWPDGDGGETNWTAKLLQTGLPWGVPPDRVQFGCWGGIKDGARAVTHIGYRRNGHSY